ncbi:MAG: phosphatidate cytidylyltransferase, partial [Gammaproteobacteria bacterium]|nr:phosphatidate cytidylyltransferase [Gammaproteobacteria bacterium]
MQQRVLTALILAPLIILGTVTLSSDGFALMLTAVFAPAIWEWSGLIDRDSLPLRIAFTVVSLLSLLAIYLFSLDDLEWLLWLGTAFWVLATKRVIHYPQQLSLIQTSRGGRFIAGLLVLVPAWGSLILLHTQFGVAYLLLLVVLIWGADIGAYFSGRRWGRHKLAPAVSPGKSWEGVAGGALLALLAAVAIRYSLELPLALIPLIIISLLVVAISIVGDLFESLFKRIAGVKDSGNLLPGHGGVLDRIDSLTAAA